MSASVSAQSFVVFPLGGRHFALPSEVIVELSRPGRVQPFPHTTPELSGVLVRRNLLLPVWEVAHILLGCLAPGAKFYLIVRRRFGVEEEYAAIPADGTCQMVQAELQPSAEARPVYVRGGVAFNAECVDVLDLERLAFVAELSGSISGEVAP